MEKIDLLGHCEEMKASILLLQFKPFYPVEEIINAIESIKNDSVDTGLNCYIALPSPYISLAAKHSGFSEIIFGDERVLKADPGDFTSTIAGRFSEQEGSRFALIGSSDERKILPTSSIKNKLTAILSVDVIPILCIGESLEEFDDGNSKEVLRIQLTELLADLSPEAIRGLHILYDVPWINQTPWESSDQVPHRAYRQFSEVVAEEFNSSIANDFKLLYSLPVHSPNLSEFIESISSIADGFYLGDLSPVEDFHVYLSKFQKKNKSQELLEGDPEPLQITYQDDNSNIVDKDSIIPDIDHDDSLSMNNE